MRKLTNYLKLSGILSSHAFSYIRYGSNMMAHSLGNAFVHLLGGRYGIKIFKSGMKKLLDQYISENYQEVRAYTLYFLQRTKSTMEADTVINNSYLHVINIQESQKDIDLVKSYLLNTIKYQILWTTSKSHRDDAITAMDGPHNEVEDEQDLKDKVREDIQYSHQKAIIEIYRAQIEDNVHRIVFEAYIDKGYTTARAMAKYFGITVTSAHYLIKEIKQNLNSLQYRYEAIANI